MTPPPKYLRNEYDVFPDSQDDKEVALQAAGRTYLGDGDRHVTLLWTNGRDDNKSETIVQLVQLTGGSGNYNFFSPVAESRKTHSIAGNNELFQLGTFSRAARDRIIELAESIKFSKNSNKNGCRVWTRDLLEMMVKEGMLSNDKFEEVDKGVPLVLRILEARLSDEDQIVEH